jgi:uncharacterized repeat protein (TIGR02543 family)
LYIKSCKIFVLQVLILENEEKKMKTRKTVIAVLSAVLLISAALIVGCMNQLDGITDNVAEDNYQVPEGKGLIRFKFADFNARTILPDNNSVTGLALANMKFDVVYTGTAGGNTTVKYYPVSVASPGDRPTAAEKASLSAGKLPPIALTADSYTIVVTAFTANGATAVAEWSSLTDDVYVPSGKVTVGGGTAVDVTANLVAIFAASSTNPTVAQGTFSYVLDILDLPAVSATQLTTLAYTAKTLDVENLNTSAIVSKDFDDDPLIATINLDAGYYIVTFTLEADHCHDRVVEHIMHIYPGMTSRLGITGSPETIPAPNQNQFTVRFNLQSVADTTTIPNYTSNITNIFVNNADSLSTTSAYKGVPSNAGYTFNGWYDAPTSGTLVTATIAAKKIFKDEQVYAQWTPIVTDGVDITVTFVISDPTNISVDGGTSGTTLTSISYQDIVDATESIVITVTGLTSVTSWNIDGTVFGGTSAVVTIDDTFTYLSQLSYGTHVINVRGIVGASTPYSENITFTVEE